MKIIFKKNKSDHRKITLFAAVHGDEKIGLKACDVLSTLDISSGRILGIEANSAAVKKNVRFIDQDLNRCFGNKKNNTHEYKLAKKLHFIIKNSEIVIDIHGTDAKIDSLVIVTKWNKTIRNILKQIPIRKIMYVKTKNFGKGSLINESDAGFALEYGPSKEGAEYIKCVNHIKQFLINQGMVKGKKKIYSRKELYTVSDVYKVLTNFEPSKSLREFRKISRGQYIGNINGKKVMSTKTFYPIFLHEGSYIDSLSLVADRQNILLK